MDFLSTPEGQLIIGISILIILMFFGDSWSHKKRRLTIADWAKTGVILRACQVGFQQLCQPKVKSVCLWIGDFSLPEKADYSSWFKLKFQLKTYLSKKPPAILIPSCNPLIEVVGKSGSGKTYSVINPMLLSAIAQGHPIVLYDAKSDEKGRDGQTPFILTYAKKQGYDVKVFAPGKDFSCTINLLDFMKDHNDKAMASVIAKTFQENLRGDGNKKDGFFGPAGERLMTALIQYAKYTEQWAQDILNSKNSTPQEKHWAEEIKKFGSADLATPFKFLGLSDLPKRLDQAKETDNPYFPYWVRVPFQQLIAVKDADPTTGGILGQANDLLEELQQPHFLRSYIGKTDVNLRLGTKQLLIFQSDSQRRAVINPLIAAVMTILINLNFSQKRDCPLIVCLDEFPTLKLNKVPDWANELRSKGLVLILGYQEFNQLEKAYGKENSEIIRGPANHRFWFNPGTAKTAKELSDFLGQTETIIKNKSRSRNFGSNGGGSQSISEQIMQTPLISADEINTMIQGECIYIGAECVETLRDPRDGKQKNRIRPWHLTKIPLPFTYSYKEKQCEKLYDEKVYPWLCQRAKKRFKGQHEDPVIALQADMMFRENLADFILPKPTKSQNDQGSNNSPPNFDDLF